VEVMVISLAAAGAGGCKKTHAGDLCQTADLWPHRPPVCRGNRIWPDMLPKRVGTTKDDGIVNQANSAGCCNRRILLGAAGSLNARWAWFPASVDRTSTPSHFSCAFGEPHWPWFLRDHIDDKEPVP